MVIEQHAADAGGGIPLTRDFEQLHEIFAGEGFGGRAGIDDLPHIDIVLLWHGSAAKKAGQAEGLPH
jgi:hypothetical protein